MSSENKPDAAKLDTPKKEKKSKKLRYAFAGVALAVFGTGGYVVNEYDKSQDVLRDVSQECLDKTVAKLSIDDLMFMELSSNYRAEQEKILTKAFCGCVDDKLSTVKQPSVFKLGKLNECKFNM